MTELHQKLQQISRALDDPGYDRGIQREIEQELGELQRRAGRFRDTEEYVTFVEFQLGRARAIRDETAQPDDGATADVTDADRIEHVDSVDWRRVPLCGCQSPTCALKRGDLPAACRDRSRGLLDDRTAAGRIRDFLQSHSSPHALRVAHRSWVDEYDGLLADTRDLLAKAVQNRPGNRQRAAERRRS